MMLKKLSKTDYLFIILLIACIFLNLWKSRYGFASSDESFYVTLVDRFYKGDLMIVDEWHPSQFPAVLLIPFYSIFRLFSHGTDGVILFFRIFYIFFNTLAGIYLYIKTRKYGICSVFTTCCYLLFTVGEMMASNYNTIGLASFVVFSLTYCDQDKGKIKLIVAGIFFSITVLCVPMLAVVYFIWSLIAILNIIKNKKIFNDWLYLTIGIIIMAIPVTGFMLYGSSINAIIENLGYMFSQGDVHGISLLLIIKKMLYLIYLVISNNRFSMIGFSLYTIILIALLLDKNKQNNKNIYILLCLVMSIFISIGFYNQAYYTFYSVIPLFFVCIITRLNDRYLNKLFIISLIYSLAINASSDTIIYATSQGIMLCSIIIILLISMIRNKIIKKLNYTLLFLLCILLCYSKIDKIYGDISPKNLSCTLNEGPMKYIITEPRKEEFYQNNINAINDMDLENKNVLFFTDNAWMYLVNDNIHYSTYSTWLCPWNSIYLDAIEDYYKVNPDKYANYIYIPKKDIHDYMYNNNFLSKYEVYSDSDDIICYEKK